MTAYMCDLIMKRILVDLTIKFLGIEYHDALNNTKIEKRGFINK